MYCTEISFTIKNGNFLIVNTKLYRVLLLKNIFVEIVQTLIFLDNMWNYLEEVILTKYEAYFPRLLGDIIHGISVSFVITFCSSYQGYLHSKLLWKLEIVSPSGPESRLVS